MNTQAINNKQPMNFKVLHEDPHILIVEKPPMVPSQGDKTGDVDMLTLIEEYLRIEYHNTKKPYVGLIHRLDRPVGGIMVFAKTQAANRELSEQVRLKKLSKIYYGVVCSIPKNNQEVLIDYLLKLTHVNMSKVVNKDTSNAKEAILDYEVIEHLDTNEYGPLTLLKINLRTGRHHQIRVQLSNANLPLWGDNKYNKTFVKGKDWTQIALWAGSLTFEHPKTKKQCTFEDFPSERYPFNLFKIR